MMWIVYVIKKFFWGWFKFYVYELKMKFIFFDDYFDIFNVVGDVVFLGGFKSVI